MHSFTFNGQTSTDFGIGIERFRPLNRPARKYDVASIAGRSGKVYDLKDVWDEVSVSYEIWAAKTSNEDLHAVFTNIMEWLNSADGYAELTDTYDTNHYRLAVFVDSTDIANSWNTKGRAVITFRCRPERFLVQDAQSYSSTATITNSTNHTAKPLITLYGTGETSKLMVADRDVYNASSGAYDISEGLPSVSSAGFAFMGINLAVTSMNSTYITSYSFAEGTLTFTPSTAWYGIGLIAKVQPLTTYTFSCSFTSSAGMASEIIMYDEFGQLISASGDTTFKTTRETWYIMVIFRGKTAGTSITFSDIMLNYGDEAKSYLAYVENDGTVVSSLIFGFGTDTRQIGFTESFDIAYVDTETEQIYAGDANLNPVAIVTGYTDYEPVSEFPVLPSGETTMYFSNISTVTIDFRFWEI